MAFYKGKHLAPTDKRRTVPAVILAVLLLAASVTAAWAYYLRQTESKENTFSPAYVSCRTCEVLDGNQKTSVTVENTSNVSVYIRIRLVSYWKTPSGDIAGRTATVPSILYNTDSWIADPDTNTYYYMLPVKPGEYTYDLLTDNAPIVLEKDEDGYLRVIEILAEAIQADPITAVQSAWPVTVENGILSVTTTS